MPGADRTPPVDAAVRLHLNRRIGWGFYGTVTAVVFVLVVVGTVANLLDGRIVFAAVIAVVGLVMTAFLVVLTRAMVLPGLTVSAAGISGRTPLGTTVDVAWTEITIDVDDADKVEDPAHCTIRLDVGDESVTVNNQSWIGFDDFVVLVCSTPHAASRLTRAARQEVVRLLQIDR